MNVFVAIDDTDNLETQGTGHLAERIAQRIEANEWGSRSYITRHQLFVHPDVPYTSHNSSMCFVAELGAAVLDAFILEAASILERESAVGSDPGLCVASADRVREPADLVEFGRRAKRAVVNQAEAYDLARRFGVHLSGHGGTGGGVIGALAGVGLRIGGNDGRVRGGLEIANVNGVAIVHDILANPYVDAVRTVDGAALDDGEPVLLVGEKIKAVLLGGKSVLLVTHRDGERDGVRWQNCPKELLKGY
jgi:hypothetical protein